MEYMTGSTRTVGKTAAMQKSAESRKVNKIIPKEVLASVPVHIQPILREIVLEDMTDGIVAMMERERSFSTPTAALMAGVAVHGESARHFDERLDALWAEESSFSRTMGSDSPSDRSLSKQREIIIGAGLHAAVYCAVRAAQGFPRPIVLEAKSRVGGAFAVSREPSFYLNSRNRPGELGLPGMDAGLNVIPGAPLQPADLDAAEYQTNAALAWAIRLTLAFYGKVVPNSYVSEITAGPPPSLVMEGRYVQADRVIMAPGLGKTYKRSVLGANAFTFEEFMATMDEPFPLRGMKRVAVVGAGDSGKTAIEALTGQGPSTRWSVASIDWVDQIDWYGCSALTCQDFEAINRRRYRNIGKLLTSGSPERLRRVRPLSERSAEVSPGFDCVYVNERPYDAVILCTGYEKTLPDMFDLGDTEESFPVYYVGTRVIARQPLPGVFLVGPAAELDITAREQAAVGPDAARILENRTALFRYASRTSALAVTLPA